MVTQPDQVPGYQYMRYACIEPTTISHLTALKVSSLQACLWQEQEQQHWLWQGHVPVLAWPMISQFQAWEVMAQDALA